jgi:pyruvate formate lyase activating enzyme
MKIAGMVKTSCIDFPGRLSIVVFTPGCNYDCWYCQNRHLLERSPQILDEGEVMRFIHKRAGMLDGVVVSGGEPTLQEGLCEFLAGVKELGYEAKVDTNGSRPDVIRKILDLQLADYIAMDYKAPWDTYPSVCGRGADPDRVRETLQLLLSSSAEWELRTTVLPDLTQDDLCQMAAAVPVLPRYILQRYRAPVLSQMDIRQKGIGPYSMQGLINIAETVRMIQPNVEVRDGALQLLKMTV